MNPKTARTAAQTAIVLFISALLIMSPPAKVLLFALAALFSLVPAGFGGGKWRIVGVILILVSLALAVAEFGTARRQLRKYQEGGHRASG